MRGMELLAVETVLERQKTRRTVSGNIGQMEGILANLSGQEVEGYELHMGCTRYPDGDECPMVICQEEVYGSYVHGIFDKNDMAARLLQALAERKGALLDTGGMMDYRAYKETQYDKLADGLRAHLELDEVYGMLREAKI
jgi:adenosylcobyric acid synthase